MWKRFALALWVFVALPGCLPAVQPHGAARPVVQSATTNSARYEARVDPAHGKVTITPVGLTTQATGFFVRSENALWVPGTTTFSFDLLATNNTGGALSAVKGVLMSTTPGSPTVLPAGTSGTTGGGKPYYDYGALASGATGTATWQFSDPSATPFRFGFTLTKDLGTDLNPTKNKAATVALSAPGGTSVSAGGSLALAVNATDPNGDLLTYTWSALGGGTITGSGSSVTYTAPYSGGTFPVSVTVDDGKGGTVTNSFAVSVAAPAIVTSGLVLYLDAGDPLSYPGTGTTWTDLSGQGNHGTLTNGPAYASANGGSVVFDGANDYVNLGSALNAKVRTSLPISLETVAYLAVNAADNALIGNTWQVQGLLLRKNSANKLRFLLVQNGSNYIGYDSPAITAGWHHIVATYNGSGATTASNMKLYLDNSASGMTSLASGSVSSITPVNNLNLARSGDNVNYAHLNGKMALARIYDRALSAAEVQQNFDSLKSRFGIP